MSLFIHHENITAKNSNAAGVGTFNIIETNEGFFVYENSYLHAECGTLAEAIAEAKLLAEEFDKTA
jgi:hypothetical protein